MDGERGGADQHRIRAEFGSLDPGPQWSQLGEVLDHPSLQQLSIRADGAAEDHQRRVEHGGETGNGVRDGMRGVADDVER